MDTAMRIQRNKSTFKQELFRRPTHGKSLNTFERKILRRIYGPIHEGGCWRPRWNNELYSLYKEPNIVEDINIRRLEWAGHIMRMEEERIQKKVLN
jgi:hypothetical protein